MARRYSIAETRAELSGIVAEIAGGEPVEITRRGKPVAVILSCEQYERLRSAPADFSRAYAAFLQQHTLEDIGLEDDFLRSLRSADTGRAAAS